MIFDQPGSYRNSTTISDGATLLTGGIDFTNGAGGIILGGGVNITIGGSTFINELGAEVGQRNSVGWYTNVSVQGSSGSDTVINGGRIFGKVLLGDGDDLFVDRNGFVGGSGWGIYLEGGDDVLRIESPGYAQSNLFANGGDGYDTVIVSAAGNDPRRAALFGFERLILETGGNIDHYSGFDSIVLASTQQYSFYNFIDCLNPAVDLFLPDGQSLAMSNSQFRSITGSNGVNSVKLWSGGSYGQPSQVFQDIQLADGDDKFTFDAFYGGINPSVGGLIDGGAGQDSFEVVISDGNSGAGTINLDLTQAINFENLYINSLYDYLGSEVILNNLTGFGFILAGEKTKLTLSSADLPYADLKGAAGGSVTLGSSVVIESYNAFRFDPIPGSPAETDADASLSVTFINDGTVVSSVRFAGGSDLYDGREGSVGGLVDGGAGDDRLIGGSGTEHFSGGAGNDVLDGGAGADSLSGGEGFDYALYNDASGGVVVDLLFASSENTGEAAGDSYVSIEGLYGSSFGDNLRGDQNDNWLWGNGGSDYLFGRGGNDVLVGSGDTDTLVGEDGDDTLYGNDGSDYLYGGAGADSLNGGNGFDYALYSFATTSIIADLQFASQTSGEAVGDSYTGIEGLVGSAFLDSLRGDAGDNYLWGAGGSDALYGRDGNDVLIGGAGNDHLIGGSGNDTFVFGTGDGRDTIYDMQSGNGAGDVVRLAATLGINSYASLQAHAAQVGADTVITFDNDTTLTILNTQQWSLAVDDFVFI